jgi:small subunit ribosomal protein S16
MVKIRLSRGGRKKLPVYRVVITEARTKRDGKFIEIIGQYKPLGEKLFEVDEGRYNYWIEHGAQPSERITKLMEEKKGTKVNKHERTT